MLRNLIKTRTIFLIQQYYCNSRHKRKMSNTQKHFEKSVNLYETKASLLPPKISWKLDLILYMMKGNLPNKDLLSIQQQMEFEDLQNLDLQSLKIVFNNIIDTLFSKQSTDIKKCMLRKKGLLSSWIHAEILHDRKNFLITYSHKTYTYEKTDCQIKISKESKRSFDLYFHKSFKFTLKFQNESQMKSIWHLWQKQIINNKTQKNYEEMKTFVDLQNGSALMERISLFNPIPQKKQFSPEKTSFSPQSNSFKSHVKQNKLSMSLMVIEQTNRRNHEHESIQLKSVPYGYVSKIRNENSVIALSRDDNAKIYIEHIFDGNYNKKRILSLLLLQKPWNSYILTQSIEKSPTSQSQIIIHRKYKTQLELGQNTEINIKASYSAWSSKMSMIIIENQHQNHEGTNILSSKSIIAVQVQENNVRISIEDEIRSSNHPNEKLKKIIFEMYREITKLYLLQEKIAHHDFEAETLITSMLEDDVSTNTQSGEDLSSFQNFQQKISRKDHDHILGRSQSMHQHSKKSPNKTVLRLKSPLQLPSLEYLRLVNNKQYEKNYFKFNFPQDNLQKYQTYIPYYRFDKLIQAKIYQITPSRELKFIDQELLDSQKETLRFVLRQIGANLISGKSVLNVSLPVDIFQSRTGLERSAASFACCPDYLIPMAQSSPIQQLKHVTGFIINVISCDIVMQKPFNPLLGETFQGYIRGIPIYYQQTSHHPPISSYYMKCNEFTLYGNLIPFADVGLNTGVGGNLGPMNIVFANGTHFECYFPPSEIAGLIYGDRKFRCYNKGFILQKKNKLYTQFSIQNQKKGVYQSPVKLKGGQIIGGIYKVKDQFIDEVERFKKQNKNMKKFGGLSKQYIVEKCHSISGEWFSNIFIDSVAINQGKNLYPVEFAKNVLPSDSNHRLDVLYHRMKDLTNSQKEKQVLQIIQRNDRKLREKYGYSSH